MSSNIRSREFPTTLTTMLASQEGTNAVMSLRGDDASNLVDTLDQVSKPPEAKKPQEIADMLDFADRFGNK
jgi:hypothetical protein